MNYAVHPEVLGPEAGILSPDLIGPLYDHIREQGGGTGIFMNSAEGGMVTADNRGADGKSVRAWPECVRIGNLLAEEALRIVQAAPEQRNPRLFCAARTVSFPVESPLLRAVMMSSPLRYPTNDASRVAPGCRRYSKYRIDGNVCVGPFGARYSANTAPSAYCAHWRISARSPSHNRRRDGGVIFYSVSPTRVSRSSGPIAATVSGLSGEKR